MNCQCGAEIAPTVGRGRPRVRCRACAADRARLGKKWRASNPARVDAYNAARRADYAAHRDVAQARARLRYAVRTGVAVARARFSLARAVDRESALARQNRPGRRE